MNHSTPAQADRQPAASALNRERWKVLAWLCSFAALTYVGRIGIIQVQDQIELDLRLGPEQLAYAFAAFSLAYALFEVPSGWLGDKLGPRKLILEIALCWIVFTAFTGTAWGLVSLVIFRFLFGLAEAGAFPNISRASREWFAFKERGFTQGLIWLFARWGGAVAPLIMAALSYPFGWRIGFLFMGVLGIPWLWGFYARFHDTPPQSRGAGGPAANLASIKTHGAQPVAGRPLSWSTMLRSPTLWALSLMYFCSNAGWSFFVTWITPYLQKDLGLSGLPLVIASGGPLFLGGIACVLGGFFTDRQVRLWGRRWGRTLQGVVAYALGGLCMLAAVAFTPKHIGIAYALVCLSSFVKDLGMAASWSTTIDIGDRYSGTVAGVMNSVGNLGQVISVPVVAWLAIAAGTPAHPRWGVTLFYYAAMFFIAAVSWIVVDPTRVIVYAPENLERDKLGG
jgi:MFS transporter, ACS family, glucarate transporter